MTLPSSVLPADQGSDLPRAALRRTVSRSAAAVLSFIRTEPQWIGLGILYLFAWYIPFTDHGVSGDGPLSWCWADWKSISATTGFQLYVPLAVAIVIFSNRAALAARWRYIAGHYPPGHAKREGNMIPLAVGALMLVFAHFVQVKGVGVAALVVMAWGIVYRIYGPLMLQSLRTPLAMLLLMIPPPDHLTSDLVTNKVMTVVVAVSAGLLSLIGVNASASGTFLHLRGYAVEISPITCAGSNVVFAAMLVLLTYRVSRRAHPTVILISVALGAVVALTLHIVRVAAISVIFGANPELAGWMMNSATMSWIEIAAAVLLTLWLQQLRFAIRAPNSVLRGARVAGNSVNYLLIPLTPFGKLFTLAGRGWRLSERAIERWFKAITPKRKRRRRH